MLGKSRKEILEKQIRKRQELDPYKEMTSPLTQNLKTLSL